MYRSAWLFFAPRRMRRSCITFCRRSYSSKAADQDGPSMPRTASLDFVQSNSPIHFYQNRVLEQYVNQPVSTNTLRQYIFFGRQMNEDRLVLSANWVHNELLVRLAHRIRDFQQLPFVVGTNPNIEFTYRLYWGAFETFRRFKKIETQEDNDQFCDLLRNLLEDGKLSLPRLARGIRECASAEWAGNHLLDGFLYRMIRSRISRQMLAEHHLALTDACEHSWDSTIGVTNGYVGIIHVHCSANEIVQSTKKLVYDNLLKVYPHVQTLPDVILDVHPPLTNGCRTTEGEILFAYIPEQLEHILYELLSNAVRFTMHQHKENYPPILVTVSANDTDINFRISDQGGGISNAQFNQLWSYQERAARGEFVDFQDVNKMPSSISDRVSQTKDLGSVHLGIGLIMSRIYAEYWSGELELMTMDGYGTDAYVRIPRLGTKTENIGFDKKSPHDDPSSKETDASRSYSHVTAHRHHINRTTAHHPRDTPFTGHGWSQSTMILS